MSRDRRSREQRSSASEATAQRQTAPGKMTRVERSGVGHSKRQSRGEGEAAGGTAAERTKSGGGERAGDWRIDQMLLSAMGFGDLGQAEGEESQVADGSEVARERHSDALEAAAADREARERDPVVLYLNIHSNSVAHAVAAMLQEHQDEWPAPSREITWSDAARFTRKMVHTLCPVVRDDSFALFQLVHPLNPDDAYRRHVAGARAARTMWIPGFGEAVAAQVKAAMFPSIERLGARFQAAAMAGNGEPPAPPKIVTSHPLDTYVRGAMSEEGILDYSLVSRPATPLPSRSTTTATETSTRAAGATTARATAGWGPRSAGSPRGARGRRARAERGDDARDSQPEERDSGATAKPQQLTLRWLGREDAKLWNYVRVSPSSATAEEVAAALYGNPAQSRMAFALQRHGELFQVAPKQARELIASRYPGEVTGHGTARDGAALAGSSLGDELALRETSNSTTTVAAHARLRSPANASGASASSSVASPDDATTGESVTLPQLMELHFAILAELEKLRAIVAPFGLASRLEPAFAFRARTMLEASHADAAERQQWRHVWHGQHVHLMMIAAAVPPLATQAATTPNSPTTDRAAAARARLSKYLAAAAISHIKSSCAAVLAELEAERRQELMDQATDSQIGLHDALRQANATPGQGTERGSDEADAALTRAQARVLRGAGVEQLQEAQLAAEEVALRTRLETVRLALNDLSAAADEAGHGLSSQLASLASGKFRSLPALINEIQLRLHDVERQWAAAERKASTFDVAADDRAAELQKQQARAAGLDAARQAFSTIAKDQDIGTFLRESQQVVSNQQFRSGIVKLAGALVITVATSGMAAQLGAGLAGLVGAGEAGGALTAGALAARAGGAAINLAVNVTVNSALQYAMSEGHDAMGWALVENALMELATRGLGQVLKGPMTQLRAMEQQVLRDGQRLGQLVKLERDAGRRGASLTDELAEERDVLRQARADRAGWFVADLTVEMVTGMASQWAARSLLHSMRGSSAEVSDDFASNVLQQGAAIMLGKRLFGLKDAWQARRAELEAQPWFTQLPEARTLIDGRTAFFGRAHSLSESLSPEPLSGMKLLAHHEELVRLELAMVARGDRTEGHEPHAAAKEATPAPGEAGAVQPRAPAGDRGGETKEPIGLFGKDARALTSARLLLPEPGYIDVFVHASAERLVVKRLDVDVEVTPRQFAAHLRKQGLEGMKLRLVGCSTGAHPDAVAQQLADAHGMEVLAPTKDIWTGPNGEHGIGDEVGDRSGRWKAFRPRDKDSATAIREKKERAKKEREEKERAKKEGREEEEYGDREPTPFEKERLFRESELDADPPESVYAPHVDRRVRVSNASPEELATMRQAMRVPVVVDAALVDGVRILARRIPRRIGFDLVVQEVHVGGDTLTGDVLAHTRTIAAVEQYNGLLANLRELRLRFQDSVWRWLGGGQPFGRSTADAALRTARGEDDGARPLEEQPLHFPRGSRGWVTELELRKLHELLQSRETPLHEGAVDQRVLADEIEFLKGRRLLHEDVLRSIDDTALRAPTEGDPSLERPDTGEVTRDALAQGYKLPGAEENAQPDWYYYRNSTELPGQFELARRPGAPASAPGLRARVVGDTFTGFETLGSAGGTEIPPGLSPQEVVTHLRKTTGFGEYLKMLERQGLASEAVVNGVIQHELKLLAASRKRQTTEALRAAVRDYFRDRVTQRMCDPSLSDSASWQRLREMAQDLSPSERGNLAELWYRHRHTKGGKGQTRVDVARTSGIDEGQVQRRVVDAVEGDTAIEVKDVAGPIDQDQFGAYMDMLQNPVDGSEPMFQKVKYVFTKPEGAIANLEFMAGRMRYGDISGRLVIECFDSSGNRHSVSTYENALRLLKILRSSK